jgi:hypothetical protein
VPRKRAFKINTILSPLLNGDTIGTPLRATDNKSYWHIENIGEKPKEAECKGKEANTKEGDECRYLTDAMVRS